MASTETPTPPALAEALDVLEDPLVEAFGMVIEAHNELANAVANGLRDAVNLPTPWVGVLIRLARSPGHRLRMSYLARDMTMSNSGLTRLIDRIEAAGHVRREACPEDRRGLHAVLTTDGMEAVAAATPRHMDDLRETLAAELNPAELQTLTDLLRRVRDRARAVTDRS